jgi:anti-anti-sigma factor
MLPEKNRFFTRGNLKAAGEPKMDLVASDDHTLVSVCGQIDIDSSPLLRDRLLALLQPPYPKVLSVDLSHITQFDSSGVATLIEALKIARASKIELRLQGLQGRLLHLFESTRILSLFDGNVLSAGQGEAE